jgi:hypothetical protein
VLQRHQPSRSETSCFNRSITSSVKILRRLERIETLPKTQQTAVPKTIDNALELHSLKTATR